MALPYVMNVCVPTQVCGEQKEIMWLERRTQQLTVDILMFKKLYICLQFGDKKAGFIFFLFDENWLKIFINSQEQNCTNLHAEKFNMLLWLQYKYLLS